MKTYIFKTNFLRDKKIIREIEASENTTLYKLAEAIVGAYDFDFDHAFGFFRKITDGWDFENVEKYELFADLKDQGIEPVDAGSVKKTKISEVWKQPKDKMLFLFDYGDEWRFVVELADFGATEPKTKYPRVIKKVGNAPEQYSDYDEE